MYTHGNIEVHNTTLIGSFVARSAVATRGRALLDRVEVIQNPDLSEFIIRDINFEIPPRFERYDAFGPLGQSLRPQNPGFGPPVVRGTTLQAFSNLSCAEIRALYDVGGNYIGPNPLTMADAHVVIRISGQDYTDANAAISALAQEVAANGTAPDHTTIQNRVNGMVRGVLDAVLDNLQQPLTPPPTTVALRIDLNEFLRPEDRIRILLWKDL